MKQCGHPEDADGRFARNVRKFKNYTVQKHRRPSVDKQPL
jgi:hypothetical protein